MNKNLRGLLAILILMFVLIPTKIFADDNVKLWVNGNYVQTDTPPMILNNRTLVPIRVISENLGFYVEWASEDQSVSVIKFDSNDNLLGCVIFFIGDNKAYVLDTDVYNNALNAVIRGEISEESAGLLVGENFYMLPLESPAVIINDRTYIPLRFIAEMFGEFVGWDDVNKTAIVGDGYDFFN